MDPTDKWKSTKGNFKFDVSEKLKLTLLRLRFKRTQTREFASTSQRRKKFKYRLMPVGFRDQTYFYSRVSSHMSLFSP